MLSPDQFSLYLTDNDIVSKLAKWRLLHHLPEIFNCSVEQIAVLPTVKIRARNAIHRKDRLFQDAATAEYAYDFLKTLPEPEIPPGDLISELQRNPNIDAGEALLLAIALTEEDSLFATGDKRAIRSIGQLHSQGKYLSLAKRVICLEQLMACLIKLIGFPTVQASVRNDPVIDTATRMIWGSRIDSAESSVEDGLTSYLADLDREAPGVLMEAR